MNPQDLFNDIKAIKADLAEISQRPAPVTAAQVRELVRELASRPVQLNAQEFARHVLPQLQQGMPDVGALGEATQTATQQINQAASEAARTIRQSVQGIPTKIRVRGDIYGFTSFYAALVYGLTLVVVVFGAWLVCNYYREQAQATVIYQQAQGVVRERNYYYGQIEDYKRNNRRYGRLFPPYEPTP